jgi:Protein of unknown function (DUF1573)
VFAQNNNPVITAKSDSYDFGTVVEGQLVKYSFEIQNTGSADLKIDRVNASCGCTVAKQEKSVLKPSEKTMINVEFNSQGKMGPQEKFIYIFSNDPKSPEFKFSMKGVVVDKNAALPKNAKTAKLKLDKNQHDFGTVAEGKIVEVKIGFKNEGKGILNITDVKTSCGCTAALLSSKTLQPGESGTLRIELDTTNRDGKLTRTVTLYTNDPVDSNQTVTLFANIEKRQK